MLPSMPILFTRESQDGFGNKIEPSTSFFNQDSILKPIVNTEPVPHNVELPLPNVLEEINKKTEVLKKEEDTKAGSKTNDSALEAALIRSYYTKVQVRFSSYQSVPTNKFVQFREILKFFDPTKETPVDLYKKIEQLFGEEHKDIVEEFLLFLKPEQALEVGRFMDQFMLMQMTNFIELLQSTFSRKPTVLRKILRAITTGINSGSSDVMKTRVLPHLRSNTRLTQMFKSMFPDERPSDSVYEPGTDNLGDNFLTCDKGYDVWEFEEESDNKKKLDAKKNLDTMYFQGRVFLQHGRMLRAARVTYPYSKEPYRVHARRLLPSQCRLSPPESDEDKSPKRNSKPTKRQPKQNRKQLKSPTKTAKDVNDNTKLKDTVSSPKATKGKQKARTKSKEKKDLVSKDPVTQKRDKKERCDSKSQSTDQKKYEAPKAKQAKIEPKVVPENKKVDVKSNTSWTREEDKTMLQILKGQAGSEQIFCKIRELLPHRSATEIKERFCHVMNLLQQMAVGDVT